jgi:hypothetical protein
MDTITEPQNINIPTSTSDNNVNNVDQNEISMTIDLGLDNDPKIDKETPAPRKNTKENNLTQVKKDKERDLSQLRKKYDLNARRKELSDTQPKEDTMEEDIDDVINDDLENVRGRDIERHTEIVKEPQHPLNNVEVITRAQELQLKLLSLVNTNKQRKGDIPLAEPDRSNNV